MAKEEGAGKPPRLRIRFQLKQEDERGPKTESLWAEPKDDFAFRILNSPFYAFGVSAEDIISADLRDGFLEFREVLYQGGHSTYRLFLQGGRTIQDKDFTSLWKPISELGATYENANSRFVAVDIPPGKDIRTIYNHFEEGEKLGVWAFEEANYVPMPEQE
jgi:hypothetical protein